jgi:tRNA pseudouridine38-40 synthase
MSLAYDGGGFSGWAVQPGLRTIQGVLENGLEQILRCGPHGLAPVRLTVAGRTDAGVHARGQVVHADLPVDRWEAMPGRSDRTPAVALVTRLAGVLPPDVVVHEAALAPDGFDARFSALARRYTYRIADNATLRDPLTRNHVLWTRQPLDIAAMNEACTPLIGLRDFASFCKPRPGATTIRDLQKLHWQRDDVTGVIEGSVISDAFCHNMVRALVGASIAAGEGRKPVGWMKQVLDARDRSLAAAVVPPHGLTLEAVTYPPDHELSARAETIRAKRMEEEVLPT